VIDKHATDGCTTEFFMWQLALLARRIGMKQFAERAPNVVI
jgi:hypothetical protein